MPPDEGGRPTLPGGVALRLAASPVRPTAVGSLVPKRPGSGAVLVTRPPLSDAVLVVEPIPDPEPDEPRGLAVVLLLAGLLRVLGPIEEPSPFPLPKPELPDLEVEPPPDAARAPPAGEDALGPLLADDCLPELPPPKPELEEDRDVEPPPEAAREPPAGEEELGPLLDVDEGEEDDEVEPPPEAARDPPAGEEELGPLLELDEERLDELPLLDDVEPPFDPPADMMASWKGDSKNPPRWERAGFIGLVGRI